CLVQFLERRDDRQTTDELRNETELDQVLRLHVGKELAGIQLPILAADLGIETDAGGLGALLDDLLQPRERAAHDEQDVLRVDLQELLLRMLASALRRHRRDRSLDQLEQRLLNAFAGYVAGDRRVLALARNLVDLVDVDDAALRLVDVVIA